MLPLGTLLVIRLRIILLGGIITNFDLFGGIVWPALLG